MSGNMSPTGAMCDVRGASRSGILRAVTEPTSAVRVPRSIRSRLLGCSGVPFPLPFGIVFAFVVANGVLGDAADVPAEDRMPPAGVAVTIALLVLFAVGGVVLGIADWRREVAVSEAGLNIHTGWRRLFVPWIDVEVIEFCQIPFGRGTAPAAVLVRRDGTRVELRALVQAGRRTRQRQVDLVAEASERHGVEVRSDGSWFWRRIDLAGKPGGLRSARR